MTAPATDRGTVTRAARRGAGTGRPAVLIGVTTGLANVVGFGRQLVVGYGILQAHRRLTFPALAPAVSSVVVGAAYVAFAPLGRGHPAGHLPLAAELVLSAGTAAGVAALAITALAPVRRLGLRLVTAQVRARLAR